VQKNIEAGGVNVNNDRQARAAFVQVGAQLAGRQKVVLW
jgi:hypothetical protein